MRATFSTTCKFSSRKNRKFPRRGCAPLPELSEDERRVYDAIEPTETSIDDIAERRRFAERDRFLRPPAAGAETPRETASRQIFREAFLAARFVLLLTCKARQRGLVGNPSCPKPSSSPRSRASPADLARALGKVPKKGDHYENDEYVISSAVGHVVELRDAGGHRQEEIRLLAAGDAADHSGKIRAQADRGLEGAAYDQLKKLLQRKDIDQVINACDAGREGELIFT